MRIKKVQLKRFKRFEDLTIVNIHDSAKLVVLIGPNGCGKSSLFDAFRVWSGRHGELPYDMDKLYLSKDGSDIDWNNNVNIEFHDKIPTGSTEKKKMFYIRSAYRNEADFTITGLNRVGSSLDRPRVQRLIDNDQSISDNYQRLVSSTIDFLYSGQGDILTGKNIREQLIGEIRTSMQNVFDDLILTGPGDPLGNGTFYFDKGTSSNFHFKNLSGGEKAVFDIVLDLIIKRSNFDNTVFCIDEPDLHMHAKLQGKFLEELFDLTPENCQLWISSHSIGMMRKAVELQRAHPSDVTFLDFHGHDFDNQVTIEPTKISREFWQKTLDIALDDLAELVAPKQIVICEGRPNNLDGRGNKEFDAKCFRQIFNQEFPDTEFISVGNVTDVRNDKLDLITALRSITKGVEFIKIIDRDDRSEQEMQDLLNKEKVKSLTGRDIESYLLDDEIIRKLCTVNSKDDLIDECLQIKVDAITESQGKGNPSDDIKSASGIIYVNLKRKLGLTGCGNTKDAFLRDTIAPLVTPDTKTYGHLKREIFE